MPKHIISLKSLIGALSRSFSTAQEELTWSQLSALLDFFHKDGTTKNLRFSIPKDQDKEANEASKDNNDSNASASDKQSEMYQAPILSLISPSPLHISDGKIEFNVSIAEIDYQQNADISAKERFLDIGGHDGSSFQGETDSLPADILVDTSSSEQTQRGNLKLSMRVKAVTHQDGYDRIISKLSQLQGIWEQK